MEKTIKLEELGDQ